MSHKLSQHNLSNLAATASIPTYDRSQLTAGVLHIGVGNFHRAHQALYLERLFRQGKAHDWAIIGTGVLPSDQAMHDKLAAQDFLTTVVEQSAEAAEAIISGSMIDFIPPRQTERQLERLRHPAIHIVALTVTEGGYFLNPATGAFDANHPAIQQDATNPGQPQTTFGLIVEGLRQRKAQGVAPFTVMSCDNIPHNGNVTRDAVAGLASLQDAPLGDWIRENVAFPNGMVDRITPATSQRERDLLLHDFGIEDQWPVFCEDFTQWVLEDNFPCGRPAWEDVGVTFVPDVTPYEHMKIRILNGGHAIIAYAGALLDQHFVHDAMQHPLIQAYLHKVEMEEILPIIPPVPNTDLTEYLALIERRFANPRIGDTIARLCQDGSNRQPKFILPSTFDRLQRGQSVTGLALESALWCRYWGGNSENGEEFAYEDVQQIRLREAAVQAKQRPTAFLELDDIFGTVAPHAVFRDAFETALRSLWEHGTATTLQRYLDQQLC
jgi:mannitol 2-dehydrogenase